MKRFFLLFTILLPFSPAVAGDVLNITGSGNLALEINSDSVHQMPVMDFFRRLDRIVRRLGRLEEGVAARQLILVVDEKQPSGSCKFAHSRKHRKQVLMIPADCKSLLVKFSQTRQISRRKGVYYSALQHKFQSRPAASSRPKRMFMHWIA